MAKSGFIYTPSTAAPDNATCFLCEKSLDAWSKTDDPRIEHLAHAPDCAWAIVSSETWKTDDLHDPDSEEMLEARLQTFGPWWPHDGKRGWIPTSEAVRLFLDFSVFISILIISDVSSGFLLQSISYRRRFRCMYVLRHCS